MDFSGFENADFDFFRKKGSMNKEEYDIKKEEVRRHFRELCYQIQKSYHSTTGRTLALDKDFAGLGKIKNMISAKSKIEGMDYFNLCIFQTQDGISINLACPPADEFIQYQRLKNVMASRKELFAKFFKENRNTYIVLCKRNYRKPGDDAWEEEFKFDNNELCLGNFDLLTGNMDRLQPFPMENKKLGGLYIRTQFLKSESVKLGKQLPSRICTEIIKFFCFCEILK